MSEQPTISRRFSSILECLMRGLTNNARRINMPVPLCHLISKRLMCLHQRLRLLIARGPLPIRPRPPRNPLCETPETQAKPQKPGPNLQDFYPPTSFAWLLRMLPGTEVAVARNWLKTLLDEAETQSLIASHPTLARSLRPLCHMVGLKPPGYLKLPSRPRTRRAPSPTPPPKKPPKNPRKIWRPASPKPMTPAQARDAADRFLNPRRYYLT